MNASGNWDYTFGVSAVFGADPAMVMLMAVIGWPTLAFTFSVAAFAAFKEGLAEHGVELTGVTRRPHQRRAP
jgi:hypothetical protein